MSMIRRKPMTQADMDAVKRYKRDNPNLTAKEIGKLIADENGIPASDSVIHRMLKYDTIEKCNEDMRNATRKPESQVLVNEAVYAAIKEKAKQNPRKSCKQLEEMMNGAIRYNMIGKVLRSASYEEFRKRNGVKTPQEEPEDAIAEEEPEDKYRKLVERLETILQTIADNYDRNNDRIQGLIISIGGLQTEMKEMAKKITTTYHVSLIVKEDTDLLKQAWGIEDSANGGEL